MRKYLNQAASRHNPWPRRFRKAGVALRNAPVTVIGIGAILAFEAYSAGGIFQTTTESVMIGALVVALAPIEAVGSLLCGLLAFFGAQQGAKMRADLRPEVRSRAWQTTMLCIMLNLAPITYLGTAFAFQAQTAEWRQYVGSEEYKADLSAANDPDLDSMARREAANKLWRAQKPKTVRFDELYISRWFWAAFLYGAVQIAAGAFWIPRPETPAEARERIAKDRAARSAATREANRKAAEAEQKRVRAAAAKTGWGWKQQA